MNIANALKRVGSDTIMEYFLPKDVLDLLQLVGDEDIFKPSTLRKIVLNNMPHAEMLRNKKLRGKLITNMQRENKEELACALGIRYDDKNLDGKILSVRLIKNSAREKTLFDFFGEEVPEEEEEALAKDMEVTGEKPLLYDYQRRARRDIMQYLTHGRRRCLLHMPTGSGKTRVAVWAAATHLLESDSAMVVWLANREELCEQATEEFKAVWNTVGDRKVNVFRLFRDRNPDILEGTKNGKGGFIVASLQKMLSTDKSLNILPTLGSRVTLAVMDEAHMAIAPMYRYVLEQLVEYKENTMLLGLSATPGRTWNDPEQDAMLANFFDSKKVTLNTGGENPIEYLTRKGYIAKITQKSIEYSDRLDANDLRELGGAAEIPDSILEKLSHDTVRNHKIISEIKRLVNSGHKRIILFGTTVQNSNAISLALSVMGYVSFHVDSDTPPPERLRIIERYKSDENVSMILCNYGVFTAGFDTPKTTAVLIARPTQSLVMFSQMMGRATRGLAVGGTDECTVVSITDISLPGFRSLVEAFDNWDDVW